MQTVQLNDEVQTMTLGEVVEHLKSSGALVLEDYEKVVQFTLECGTDLEVVIEVEAGDPRIDGTRTEVYGMDDIREAFTAPEYVCWAKDELGEDILLGFGV